MKKNIQTDNEINFIELAQLIWQGRWKIFVVVVIFFLTTFLYQANQARNFNAITEIRPVNIFEINKYQAFNNLFTDISNPSLANPEVSLANPEVTVINPEVGVVNPEVTSEKLFNLYIDLLRDRLVFEDAMRKFNLLDPSQYSDQDYNEEIIKLASSVKILSPSMTDGKKRKKLEHTYHTIQFIHDDVKKWKSILKYVDEISHKLVKQILVEQYKNTLLLTKQKKNYLLEDIEAQIVNAKLDFDRYIKKFELTRVFKLEDIQTKINNMLIDYERITSDRLAFLREKASIARKLKIQKTTPGTPEAQMFKSDTDTGFVTNLKTDNLYYLRGYEAIEKEIELIENRKDKKAFISGLLELEQEKRALEQDLTSQRRGKNKEFSNSAIMLEKKQRVIKQDKTIERMELVFQSTPLAESNKFSAASANIFATKFVFSDSKKKKLAINTVIGLVIGLFYVIISNALQSGRAPRKKTN
jgi:LPS O-antigen subunit length determinant protein (WzzB/FepE family)